MSERVCGAEVELQRGVLAVLRATPADLPPAEPGEVIDPLRCVLESGHAHEHHGIARGLPLRYPGEVWARWQSGEQPSALLLLSDCPAVGPKGCEEPCLFFNGHAGAHSWALADAHDSGEPERCVRLERVPRQPDGSQAETAATQSPASAPAPAAAGVCMHLKTAERNGKTYCKDCDKQIHR